MRRPLYISSGLFVLFALTLNLVLQYSRFVEFNDNTPRARGCPFNLYSIGALISYTVKIWVRLTTVWLNDRKRGYAGCWSAPVVAGG